MGGRQTPKDVSLNRHHPLGTAAMAIADAKPGSICSAEGQCSDNDQAGATTTRTGMSREVRSSVGDYRRGACVGRIVCRRWHGPWLGTRYRSSNGYRLDGLWARHGRCASSRGTDRRFPGSEGRPSVVPLTSREGGGQ